MFTWICPQCGREVPPAYNECPDCSGKQTAQATQAAPPQAQAAPPAQSAAPVAAAPLRPQQQAAPAAPPASGAITIPSWLMSIVFAIAFLGLFAGAYWGVRHFSASGSQASASAPVSLENPPAAGLTKPSTLQKFVEVIGMRLIEDSKQKAQVRFIVVNHSGAEIADLAANVNVWARTAKSDEEAVGTFSFKLPSIGPYESKDLSAPLKTKLRVYELPDWQNLTAEVQITSPQ